jgi:hypothetical protein
LPLFKAEIEFKAEKERKNLLKISARTVSPAFAWYNVSR